MNYQKLKRAIYLVCVGYGFWQLQEHWFISNFDDGEFFKFIPWWLSAPLFFTAIHIIEKYVSDIKLLKPLCVIMGCIDLAEWLIMFFEVSIPFELYILQIFSSVISLYFNYQLITNISQLAKKCGYESIKGMLTIRTVRTVYVTVYILLLPFAEQLMTGLLVSWFGWFSVILMVNSIKSFMGYLKDLQKQKKENAKT